MGGAGRCALADGDDLGGVGTGCAEAEEAGELEACVADAGDGHGVVEGVIHDSPDELGAFECPIITGSEGFEEPISLRRNGFEAVEVEVDEGVVMDKGVEVQGVGESLGIWGEPAAGIGSVVASAVVDEACFFVEALGAKMPGIGDVGVIEEFFAEGTVAVGF